MGRRINSGLSIGTKGSQLFSLENLELLFRIKDELDNQVEDNIDNADRQIEDDFPHITDLNMIKINKEKQMRHIKGSKTNAGKSLLSITIEKSQELIRKFSGTGEMVKDYQEIVNFKTVIGEVEYKGKLYPTTFGKIHYSKTGAHLVPYMNKEDYDNEDD